MRLRGEQFQLLPPLIHRPRLPKTQGQLRIHPLRNDLGIPGGVGIVKLKTLKVRAGRQPLRIIELRQRQHRGLLIRSAKSAGLDPQHAFLPCALLAIRAIQGGKEKRLRAQPRSRRLSKRCGKSHMCGLRITLGPLLDARAIRRHLQQPRQQLTSIRLSNLVDPLVRMDEADLSDLRQHPSIGWHGPIESQTGGGVLPGGIEKRRGHHTADIPRCGRRDEGVFRRPTAAQRQRCSR